MIKRNTWILLIVFLALVAGMLLIQRTNVLTPKATPTETAAPSLLSSSDPIVNVKMTDNKGLTVEASLGDNSQWSIKQPADLKISSSNMQEVLSDFYGISVQSSLSSSFSLSATGLQTPAYVFELTLKSGQKHTLKVGSLTPTQSGYYVSLDASAPSIVLQYNVDNITELLESITYTATPTVAINTPAATTATTPVVTSTGLEASGTPTP